jgi:hypothetical protein
VDILRDHQIGKFIDLFLDELQGVIPLPVRPDCFKANIRGLVFDIFKGATILFDRLKANFRSLVFDMLKSQTVLLDSRQASFWGKILVKRRQSDAF